MVFATKPSSGKYIFEKITTPSKEFLEGFYGIVEYDKKNKFFRITQFDKNKKPHKIFLKYDNLIMLNNIIKEVK